MANRKFRVYKTEGKRMYYILRNTSVAKPYTTEHLAYLDEENNFCLRNGDGASFSTIGDVLRSGRFQIVTRIYR